MVRVSVFMPCYNAAATLPEALESLTAQTLEDFEVVAVDDGSTDETRVVLEAWAQREPRLRVLGRPHGGVIAAANAALAACQAPYLARMDADDRCHPERLARQADYLDAQPEIAVVSCLVQGFPEGAVREGFRVYLEWLNGLVSPAEIARERFVESPLVNPSCMLRRSWLEAVGGYEEHGWPEDYDLWLRLAEAGARFAKVPAALLAWREHPGRLTRTDGRYAVENFLRAKAHYLVRGPLQGRQTVIIWGAGMIGRRLSKHLLRAGAPVAAFIDIDPRKIGRTRRGKPVWPAEALPELWNQSPSPVVLAAVGARGARHLIRQRLQAAGLVEGQDWWGVA
jgi:glycosyltransferase involved in cell wall biosynthesis